MALNNLSDESIPIFSFIQEEFTEVLASDEQQAECYNLLVVSPSYHFIASSIIS